MKTHRTRPDSETSVLYVDDEEMRQLNGKFRNLRQSTDVLAFPMREGPGSEPGAPRLAVAERMIGDIVVSLETARRQSLRQGHSARREIALLLIHGALHLLGYDHPAKGGKKQKEKARKMRQAERDSILELEKQLVL